VGRRSLTREEGRTLALKRDVKREKSKVISDIRLNEDVSISVIPNPKRTGGGRWV
jgi:ABC-type sulfate transport system substrate-binding protein